MTFLADILAATFRNATPLVYGTVGETYTERAGVLNLGIEGTMYAGAFVGFAVAYQTGDPPGSGLLGAIVVGLLAGAIMAFLTVTLGRQPARQRPGPHDRAHRPERVRQPAHLHGRHARRASSPCRCWTRWPAWARSARWRTSTA